MWEVLTFGLTLRCSSHRDNVIIANMMSKSRPIREQLQDLVYKAVCQVAGVCVPAKNIKIEHPEVEEHGDYSTNIALKLKGDLPLAEKITSELRVHSSEFIGKIEVAGTGFVNFTLKPAYLVEQLGKTQINKIDKGKNVVVEYSSPNIAKPFGIGHLRSTIIGQALYNIYAALGYKVIGDNHLGDWGTQFGKLLYMIDKTKTDDFSIEELEKLYVEFHGHPEWEDEGRRWFKKLENKDTEARQIWQKCVEVSLAEFDRIYKLLGVKIDNAYGESFYEDLMPQVIADAQDIAKKSEGATIIEISNEKTPLMLLKSDGGTTYATRDLATVKFRQQKWHPDLVIYEVGAEQTLHFRQVFAAAKLLDYVTNVDSLIHTKHGLYLDTDGKKFATRKGKTIKLEEVLNEAIDRAKKLGNSEIKTAKAVGIGAIKYFELSHSIQSDIVFDWEKVMALEGNSGPYLQYTYARTQSVLKKVQGSKFKVQLNLESCTLDLNAEELAVLRWIYRYGEVVEEAALRYAPNLLCNFLYELAQRYNTFYNRHPILGNDFRLALTQAVGEVLKSGLNLLGIEALGHM